MYVVYIYDVCIGCIYGLYVCMYGCGGRCVTMSVGTSTRCRCTASPTPSNSCRTHRRTSPTGTMHPTYTHTYIHTYIYILNIHTYSDGSGPVEEVVEDTSPPITIKVRINPGTNPRYLLTYMYTYTYMHAIGDYNMKVLVSSRGTILDLKKIVAKTSEKVQQNKFLHLHTYIHIYIHTYLHTYIHTCVQSCEEDRQRIMFMGKELRNTQVRIYIHVIHTYIHTNIDTCQLMYIPNLILNRVPFILNL